MKDYNVRFKNKTQNKNIELSILKNNVPPPDTYTEDTELLLSDLNQIDINLKDNTPLSTKLSFITNKNTKIYKYVINNITTPGITTPGITTPGITTPGITYEIINLEKGQSIEYDFTYGFFYDRYDSEVCYITNINNINNYNTYNILDMSNMFAYMQVTSLDLSSFNTYNVKSMSYMFYCCSYLESLDLSSFSSYNLSYYLYMFIGCDKLMNVKCTSDFYNWLVINKDDCGCPDNMINDCKYYLVDTEETKTGLN